MAAETKNVGKPRGRFDILAVFGTAYVRFTSDKTRSLPPAEIVACLRKYADAIEQGIAGSLAPDIDEPPAPKNTKQRR